MNRKSGFYWVKINSIQKFEIARYFEETLNWLILGDDTFYIDENFYQIDNKPIKYK